MAKESNKNSVANTVIYDNKKYIESLANSKGLNNSLQVNFKRLYNQSRKGSKDYNIKNYANLMRLKSANNGGSEGGLINNNLKDLHNDNKTNKRDHSKHNLSDLIK